jgi:hypothetical protein
MGFGCPNALLCLVPAGMPPTAVVDAIRTLGRVAPCWKEGHFGDKVRMPVCVVLINPPLCIVRGASGLVMSVCMH